MALEITQNALFILKCAQGTIQHKITLEAKEEWLKCMRIAIESIDQLDDKLKVELYMCFPQLAQHMVNS